MDDDTLNPAPVPDPGPAPTPDEAAPPIGEPTAEPTVPVWAQNGMTEAEWDALAPAAQTWRTAHPRVDPPEMHKGAQVLLTGAAQAAARGEVHASIDANSAARDAAIGAGHVVTAAGPGAGAEASAAAAAERLAQARARAEENRVRTAPVHLAPGMGTKGTE